MGRLTWKPSPAVVGSKYIKRVVSGKLQGTWDMANRYFLIEVPGGIADACMKFRGIDEIHLLRFSAFECPGYQVGWNEVVYHVDCGGDLIEREFRTLKRHHPDPVDLPFPHMHGFTDFYNPACPAHLAGGRVPLRPHRLSPERRAHFPSYRDCDRVMDPHMCQIDALINGLLAQPMVVYPCYAQF